MKMNILPTKGNLFNRVESERLSSQGKCNQTIRKSKQAPKPMLV